MKRFILRYRGKGPPPPHQVEAINRRSDIRVVDQTSKMMLVETKGESPTNCAETMPEWSVTPETITPLPSPRPKLRKE